MAIVRILGPILVCLLLASVSLAADRVEIILDNSASMWGAAGSDTPRVVALREAMTAFAVTTSQRDDGLEVGLRIVGGHRDLTEDGICEDTEILIPADEVDPTTWREALADLFPRGGRPLVQAVREAVDDLSGAGGRRRIVIITSGGDTCFGDFATLVSDLAENQEDIEFRVVGLSMNRQTVDALTLFVRTRNVTNLSLLLNTLSWAVFADEIPAAKPQQLSLQVTRNGVPVNGAEISLTRGVPDEAWTAAIEAGTAKLELPTGRFRATITDPAFPTVEVAGIDHGTQENALDLELGAIPPVTLGVFPERPEMGDHVFVQFWDAPDGPGWVTFALAGSPLGSYLVRSPAQGPSGELLLGLPDTMRELEARFVREIGHGVLQLLGRTPFQCSQTRVSIESPEKVEIGTELQISWQGPNLPGDHLTLTGEDETAAVEEMCLLAASGGPVSVTAPKVPGTYVIKYLTRLGRASTRNSIEVFEVLATLDAPTELGPGVEFAVEWTGPDSDQDYLSIAFPESENEVYIDWQSTDYGNPLRLRAPDEPGQYEIRYVRSSDGALLAREPLAVAAAAVSLQVPPVVEVGTRFEVEWSGTTGRGDFLAVAREGSDKRQYVDWSYTSLGSPVSLAAPFAPGRFEVLYVSGEDQKIIARAPLKVQR